MPALVGTGPGLLPLTGGGKALYNTKMNTCPQCKTQFQSIKSKFYCSERCRKKAEKKRNRARGAPLRKAKHEAWLAEQIPKWNALRIERLDARLEKDRLAALASIERRRVIEARALARSRPVYVKDKVQTAARLEARSEARDGCRIWLGEVNTDGYGQIGIGRFRFRVHRVAYFITRGAIPAGMDVLHTCDVPLCINPDHLYAGTPKDNATDMVRRGRAHVERVNGRFAKAD